MHKLKNVLRQINEFGSHFVLFVHITYTFFALKNHEFWNHHTKLCWKKFNLNVIIIKFTVNYIASKSICGQKRWTFCFYANLVYKTKENSQEMTFVYSAYQDMIQMLILTYDQKF